MKVIKILSSYLLNIGMGLKRWFYFKQLNSRNSMDRGCLWDDREVKRRLRLKDSKIKGEEWEHIIMERWSIKQSSGLVQNCHFWRRRIMHMAKQNLPPSEQSLYPIRSALMIKQCSSDAGNKYLMLSPKEKGLISSRLTVSLAGYASLFT